MGRDQKETPIEAPSARTLETSGQTLSAETHPKAGYQIHNKLRQHTKLRTFAGETQPANMEPRE